MTQDEILERIRAYADNAHGDQTRRYSNERYIVHPDRVMMLVRDYNSDTAVLAAALLHDVLEDTETTAGEIKSFLTTIISEEESDKAVQLVQELTDIYIKDNFPRLNRTTRRFKEGERLAKASAEAQSIKYADVLDNAIDIAANDHDFAPVFLRESKLLLQQLDKGNPLLRHRAIQEVDTLLKTYFKNANISSL